MSWKAVVWQIYGALVFVSAVLSAFFELVYFSIFFYDRSILNDRFLIPSEWVGVSHLFAVVALVALIHYAWTKSPRSRALAGVPFAEEHAIKGRLGPFPVRADLVFFLMLAVLGSLRGNIIRGILYFAWLTLVHALSVLWRQSRPA